MLEAIPRADTDAADTCLRDGALTARTGENRASVPGVHQSDREVLDRGFEPAKFRQGVLADQENSQGVQVGQKRELYMLLSGSYRSISTDFTPMSTPSQRLDVSLSFSILSPCRLHKRKLPSSVRSIFMAIVPQRRKTPLLM